MFKNELRALPVPNKQAAAQKSTNAGGTKYVYDFELLQKYHVMQELGKGAFTTVRAGISKSTGETVAIKTYDNEYAQLTKSGSVIQNEIRILKRLSCPSVIKLHDIVRTRRFTHLILEFFDGHSLDVFLRQQPGQRLPESTSKGIIA